MTGNLLHLVNSALYARRGTVNSVRHALSLLGLDKVRNAVLGMSITAMWKKVKMPAILVDGALQSALGRRGSVERSAGTEAAGGLSGRRVCGGLLHDMGRLLIALGLPQHYEQIVKLNKDGRSYLEAEAEMLGFTHPGTVGAGPEDVESTGADPDRGIAAS